MLTTKQIEQFKTEGYVIAADFFDDTELKALRAEVARFRREGYLRNVATAGDGKTQTVEQENLQLVPLAPYSELFRALPFCDKVVHSTSALLGDPVVKILDQLFLKPAGRGLPTNWHTDNAYFKISDPLKGTAMWIALDDATKANGTLKVIPGVFNEHYKHFRDPSSDHHIRMAADDTNAVHCELPAGGVVFFSFGTPHATGPNPTAADRTGIGIHFLNSAYLPEQLSGGKRAEFNVPMTGEAVQRGAAKFAKYAGRWNDVVQEIVEEIVQDDLACQK
jgi:ectoine hydroxylase-related dioxygenase (phytanoyl-CoA dioxygenase family)